MTQKLFQPGKQPEEWLLKVEKIAEDVCAREGCYLYELDFVGTGRGRTLRVFIDKDVPPIGGKSAPPGDEPLEPRDAPRDESLDESLDEGGIPGGIGIEDCSNVSRGLNEILDAQEDLIPGGEYNLEVSTPGVDRVLTRPWHFKKVVGKRITVRVGQPLEAYGVTDPKWKATKTVEEKLAAVDDDGLTFEVKEGVIRIPFGAIEKSKVVFELKEKLPNPNKKPHPKHKPHQKGANN